MKLSLTESGTPKIRQHSFKEQIKETTLNRKFHYSTWTYFPAKSNSPFSRAQFTFPFHFPFLFIFHCAMQKSHTGTWQGGGEITTGFVKWNAQIRQKGREREKKGNLQFHFLLSRGGGSELMVFLLAHKLAVRTHGGARQSPENRGKWAGSSSMCTRKSTLMASGGSEGLSCHTPPPFALLFFTHLQTFFTLVLFSDWELSSHSPSWFQGLHHL